MANVSSVPHNFGSDAEGRTPCTPDKERRIYSKSTKVCRYYATGHCRRGSACRFVHLQPESAPQEYAYPNGPDVHTKTPHKGWDQNVGHSHGYTAYAVYTVAPHVAPHGFDASRNAFDNSTDLSSSSDSASSDHSLNTAFNVMTLKEPVPSERFPSAFSQSLPRIQYPNNTGTYHSNVAPGNNRGHTPISLNARAATRRKAEQEMEKTIQYKTKPCKFFSPLKNCVQGDKCRFIHDVEKCKRAKQADHQARRTAPSHLPPKPRSLMEELKARDYHPIPWRVIGGGVMMGLPCKAFLAGYCPDGVACKLAHDTELKISPNDVMQLELETQTSEASSAVSPSGQPSLDSSTESQRRTVSTDCSFSSRVRHTDGGTSDSTRDAEKNLSAPNDAASSKHRRTRSMTTPTSPSVFQIPHVSTVYTLDNAI
ncbi:hypothetical protein DEU56DRAFT_552214 [Suillus clintonianus]|uniref:uncharacterized protein n=1 Tax=Suillus clintonianus TaxID=1904413 RepID=UPI001B87310F|nr:uncharacterized protein DEU56DRAFT_552214 [Suillus clintonianus]KAG2151451.1 hypothetical protein DEU56DRAFT_552214 [Suillus clintonianus]